MTATPLSLVKDFVLALTQVMVSLIGAQAAADMIAEAFPHKDIRRDPQGRLVIPNKSTVSELEKFLAIAVHRMEENFGHEFTERTMYHLYDLLVKQHGEDAARASGVLVSIPHGYLEKEKITLLSKEELETRVWEKTKELQELNAHLEQNVLARTKELLVANQKLEEANAELERLSQAKTEFLSLVSHQLLTPLTTARWIATTLDEVLGAPNPETAKLIGDLLNNNSRMVRLVGNLLNVARIEEGRLEYKFENITLDDMLVELVSALTPIAEKKQIAIRYENSQSGPIVRADRGKLYLAFENVIENAVKYTPKKGEIGIKMYVAGGMVTVEIQDKGIGIPKEEWKNIFQKFFRARNAREQAISGSGLGLFIVKKIIEDHGGHIRFESTEGVGTTFLLELPMIQMIHNHPVSTP